MYACGPWRTVFLVKPFWTSQEDSHAGTDNEGNEGKYVFLMLAHTCLIDLFVCMLFAGAGEIQKTTKLTVETLEGVSI